MGKILKLYNLITKNKNNETRKEIFENTFNYKGNVHNKKKYKKI
tara:strand:+ start:204 stop:335 length:132 start_codon:yes stop_codon:yes gene_type:complete